MPDPAPQVLEHKSEQEGPLFASLVNGVARAEGALEGPHPMEGEEEGFPGKIQE